MAEREVETENEMTVERTSGSVYHALGHVDADEVERKARLVSAINDTLPARGLSQLQAAEIARIDQPTLSKLLRGRFRSVSFEKLAEMLNSLGRDVTIVVGAIPIQAGARGRTMVAVS